MGCAHLHRYNLSVPRFVLGSAYSVILKEGMVDAYQG